VNTSNRANIILSFKDNYVLRVRRSDVKRIGDNHSLTTDVCESFRHASQLRIKSPTYTEETLMLKQTVDGLCLPVFQYTAAVGFIQQPVHTGSAQHLMLKFP